MHVYNVTLNFQQLASMWLDFFIFYFLGESMSLAASSLSWLVLCSIFSRSLPLGAKQSYPAVSSSVLFKFAKNDRRSERYKWSNWHVFF